MSTCIHKAHHRPEVRALTKTSLFRWLASCPCGWAKGTAFWRQAIIAANIHAEKLEVNLHNLHAYSTTVARNETMSRPYLHEDAAQEGLIAGWKAMKSKVNASDAYVKKAARNGIHDAVVRQRSTGSERGSSHHLVLQHDTTALVVEGFHGPRLIVEPEDEAARLAQETAEVQPLRATVREAVKSLPEEDRLHVYLRFWGGMIAREVAQEIGKSEAYAAGRWNVKIRPALAAELSHLRGVA